MVLLERPCLCAHYNMVHTYMGIFENRVKKQEDLCPEECFSTYLYYNNLHLYKHAWNPWPFMFTWHVTLWTNFYFYFYFCSYSVF